MSYVTFKDNAYLLDTFHFFVFDLYNLRLLISSGLYHLMSLSTLFALRIRQDITWQLRVFCFCDSEQLMINDTRNQFACRRLFSNNKYHHI